MYQTFKHRKSLCPYCGDWIQETGPQGDINAHIKDSCLHRDRQIKPKAYLSKRRWK